MNIDNLKKPKTIWFEGVDGKLYDADLQNPYENEKINWKYMHSRTVHVEESIYTHPRDAKWPIRIIMWVVDRLPYSWKKSNGQFISFNQTINGDYEIIKYLVETKGWSFHDACVGAANLCERCLNICEWNIRGESLDNHKQYLYDTNTTCESCKDIDPEWVEFKKVLASYKALKFNKNIQKAFDYGFCYPGQEVFAAEKKLSWFEKIRKMVRL